MKLRFCSHKLFIGCIIAFFRCLYNNTVHFDAYLYYCHTVSYQFILIPTAYPAQLMLLIRISYEDCNTDMG